MTNAESLGQGCVGTYQGQKEGILEVRAIGANSGKHLETTTRSLDFIAITMGSHWRASHLSLHCLGDITFLFQKKKSGEEEITKENMSI